MTRIELNVLRISCAVTMAALVLCPEISRADESGISFWLPGQYGSLAAVPQTPGWALGAIYYHTSVTASGAAAAAREIQVGRFSPTVNVNLNLNLSAWSSWRRPILSRSRFWVGNLPSAWRASTAGAPQASPAR